jgi:predicted nucleic acid-binding protein
MMALDTCFVLDYLDGTPAAAELLDAYEAESFVAPPLVFFEVFRGVAGSDTDRTVDAVASGLDWIEPLPTTLPATQAAAAIEAELAEDGTRINLGETLIAGTCRHHGATVVTRNDHFERVPGLETVSY